MTSNNRLEHCSFAFVATSNAMQVTKSLSDVWRHSRRFTFIE